MFLSTVHTANNKLEEDQLVEALSVDRVEYMLQVEHGTLQSKQQPNTSSSSTW